MLSRTKKEKPSGKPPKSFAIEVRHGNFPEICIDIKIMLNAKILKHFRKNCEKDNKNLNYMQMNFSILHQTDG
jgi:hypothetical protein